jgi:ATP/maltotriose-dependent transcriptional regulator MalT
MATRRSPARAPRRSGAAGADPARSALRRGHAALAQGRWAEARTWLERAVSMAETPEALEGLGRAAWWLDDGARVFTTRQRAFQLYRQRNDRRGAARVATALAGDHLHFRGEVAVARGWHQRAQRLLQGLPLAPEHGWLKVSRGDLGLVCGEDPALVRTLAAGAAAAGRSLGEIDLEMTALALEGVALVTEGHPARGLQCLDEATAAAVSGEMTDPRAIGVSCCYLVMACERIRDFDRAAQWCARVREFCQRTGFNALLGVCRAQYAGVLIWRGAWGEAERELDAARRQLAATRPALQAEGLRRLADLRRQQGRFDDAGRLLAQIEGDPLAELARAALALDAGDAARAAHLARRALRQMPAANRTDRASALDLLARAQVALGQAAQAAVAVAELRTLAAEMGTAPFQASARSAEGLVALASGRPAGARPALEDAVDLYRRGQAAYEEARARVDLGRCLMALAEPGPAEQELRQAQQAFQILGAAWQADRAASLLGELPRGSEPPPRDGAGRLTRREIEVLRLVAQGLSNEKIGRTLIVSEFTVKRHVANILAKLELPSRAAAAAFAAHRGLL